MTLMAAPIDHATRWEARALDAEQALARVHELADTLDRGVVDDHGRKVGLAGHLAARFIRNAIDGQVRP